MRMTMHTPPRLQGGIVEVSYGWHEGRLYRRVEDRSDRSVIWTVAEAGDALDEYASAIEAGAPNVWDAPPPRGITWVPCADPHADPDE